MMNIIMHGCNGRMGQVITKIVAEDPEVQIVAGVDITGDQLSDYPVFKTIEDCDVKADVVIDFAHVSGVDHLLDYCVEKKLPLVLCTTGLSKEQLDHVREAEKSIALLKSANMSLGINTLAMLLKQATRVLSPAGFDIDIVEQHHNQKLDAPSGTALLLADAINEACEEKFDYVYDRSTRREKRPKKEIGISSVRGGSIVGIHEVIFAGLDEVIEIKHTAYSRSVFGKGAVEAAKFLVGKNPGHYDMSDAIAES